MVVPVAVFGFKRPAHLKACLQAVARSQKLLEKELPLFIFCDAARNEAEQEEVAATIAIAKEFGKGEVVVRPENFGFRNITDGISSLCNQYGKVIVIEDDVLVSPEFLPFMVSALQKYEHDPKVFMISGFMYFPENKHLPETFFLNLGFIWGWATWKRAWDHYESSPSDWKTLIEDKKARYTYDCLNTFPFSAHLRKTLTGQWKTWDPQWVYAINKAGGVALYPSRSLVWNCGCGGGTHGSADLDLDPSHGDREQYIHGNMELEDFAKPRLDSITHQGINFPKSVAINQLALRNLAVIFLKQRLIQEKRKKLRLALKLFYHKQMLRFEEAKEKRALLQK